MRRIAAILPAAGLGTRMGAERPKQFLELDGEPIFIHTLRRIASCPLVTEIIVATRADVVATLDKRIQTEKFAQPVRVVRGGDSRQESVAQALRRCQTTRKSCWFTTLCGPLLRASRSPGLSKKRAAARLRYWAFPRWTR